MPQISILVAVYNTAPYLPQCLDSLCGQTLRDIQIICIDDCSTDQSPQILADYARRDARITLLRTPHNSGQAAARNLGLQIATGEFTTFVDSDDWLAPDALEQALETLAQNPANDCAVMRLIKYYPDDGHEVEHPLHTGGKEALTGEEAFMLSLDNWAIHGVYVVRTTLHKRYPYDVSSILYTDDHVTHLHYLNARRVVMCQGRYYYRQNPASTTRACSMRRFACLEADLDKRRAIEAEAAQGHIPHHAAEALRLCETQRWCNMIGSLPISARQQSSLYACRTPRGATTHGAGVAHLQPQPHRLAHQVAPILLAVPQFCYVARSMVAAAQVAHMAPQQVDVLTISPHCVATQWGDASRGCT